MDPLIHPRSAAAESTRSIRRRQRTTTAAMAHRLSRTWQSISSLVPFLAPSPSPSHSQAHYAAIPLTTTTSSKSNDGLHGVDDDEKLLGLGAGVQVPRRHWLVLAWTYLSPFLVLLLAASIYVDRKRTALARMTVVNPYACGPKSNFTTLEAVCRAGTGPERQKVSRRAQDRVSLEGRRPFRSSLTAIRVPRRAG